MNLLKSIETSIVNNLKLVPAIKSVFDHEPKGITQLPAATMFFDGFSESDQASRRKTINWRWDIRIYIPIRDEERAQNEIKEILLATMSQLRKDPTLGNTCLYQSVASGEIFVVAEQNKAHMMTELQLVAVTYEQY
jgi:hypothetical protein